MVRKRFTPTFKTLVGRELLKEEKTLAQVAAEHGIHLTQLIKWRTTALQCMVESLCAPGDRQSSVVA